MTMRVLHVLNGTDPRLGGPPIAVRNMVVAAARQGIEIELATCDPVDAGPELLADYRGATGVALSAFPISGRAEPLARWGVSLPLLVHLWRRIPEVHVVHVHGMWTVPSILAAARARYVGVSTVLTPHETLTDFDIDVSRSPRRTRQKRALGALVLRLVDEVIFSAEIERRDSPIAKRAKSHVISHPVVDETALGSPACAVSRDGVAVVGFLGRLHPKKNLPLLLDALARCPGLELLIAGAGPHEAESRERAALLGIGGRVRWLGFIDAHAKPDFFSRVDVLAMPSQYECFGMSAVEAMAAGVPVVLSDTVGVAAATSAFGGGIVTGLEPGQIAQALGRLRDDPQLLRDCRRGALQAAREEFSFARFGARIESLYAALAVPRTPPSKRPGCARRLLVSHR